MNPVDIKKTDGDERAFYAWQFGPSGGGGLTKREYFASQALSGLLAGASMPQDLAIKFAVRAADALITELNRHE